MDCEAIVRFSTSHKDCCMMLKILCTQVCHLLKSSCMCFMAASHAPVMFVSGAQMAACNKHYPAQQQ